MPEDARVFRVGLGIDFPQTLVSGLLERFPAPEDLARVTLVLNSSRMARRVRDILLSGPSGLLPKILLLGDVERLLHATPVPAPATGLSRRLDLARLIKGLLEQRPEFAAQSAVFDLADSLAALIDEMHSEGVAPEAIKTLDVSRFSEHFAQTQAFLDIAQTYIAQSKSTPDAETRQRQITEALVSEWQSAPPRHPVILAGSTASRGTTRLLMMAIARLSQGYLVLPGVDTDLPETAWAALDLEDHATEDHPQYRLYKVVSDLGLKMQDVADWTADRPLDPSRNRLLSLALRPAPVTHAWHEEGPSLGDLGHATRNVTLVEAESSRAEALAIATRLRQAAEDGQTAALITPDRMLTRQVAAALDMWNIVPDDSAGIPLHLTAIGRFLRHTAELVAAPLTAESLITMLKHPLTHKDSRRNWHVLNTERLEVHMRQQGLPFPDAPSLTAAKARLQEAHGEDFAGWLDWVIATFCDQEVAGKQTLACWLETHIATSLAVAIEGDALWSHADGVLAKRVIDDLSAHSDFEQLLSAREYQSLLHSLLSQQEAREAQAPFPGIMIWGTLEARVQGADLVILGSLNDGVWPEQPAPDPWLNRQLARRPG